MFFSIKCYFRVQAHGFTPVFGGVCAGPLFCFCSSCMCLVYPMLPAYLDWPFLISPTVFWNVYSIIFLLYRVCTFFSGRNIIILAVNCFNGFMYPAFMENNKIIPQVIYRRYYIKPKTRSWPRAWVELNYHLA